MARDSYEAGLKIRRKMLGGPWCRAKGPGYLEKLVFQHLRPGICRSLQYLVA